MGLFERVFRGSDEMVAKAQQELETARERAQEEMCAVRMEVAAARKKAREEIDMLEGWLQQARSIAGTALRESQPVLQNLKLLAQEEKRA